MADYLNIYNIRRSWITILKCRDQLHTIVENKCFIFFQNCLHVHCTHLVGQKTIGIVKYRIQTVIAAICFKIILHRDVLLQIARAWSPGISYQYGTVPALLWSSWS